MTTFEVNKLDELEQIFSENNIEVMSFKELGTVNDYALKTMPKLIKALRECIAQNKILKEALEFYSDQSNMYGEVKECDLKEDRGGDITREFGSLAREALKKVEENEI